ncbi:hypothetical protein [Streptomyces canus]|uniref:hypothetical protein n=1 Tax=Streptomyces canus TaxID=58343 RepID=UPI0036EFB52F
MTGRPWSRRVRADHKSVAADGNIQDCTISSGRHVTNINQVHIHPASGATVEGASLPDIAVVLADLRDRAAGLAAEQITQAKRLAALEHRQTTGPTTALADLQYHSAELTGELKTQAERLRAIEDRLEDRLEDKEALSSATALTDLQRQNAELTAQFATQADQLSALEHRLAGQTPREESEPVTAPTSAQPGRVLKRRHTVRPSRRGLERIHFTYQKVGGIKLIVAMRTCSSRWCLRCVRELHGKTLAAVIGPVGVLAALAAAIGLFRVGAPWWIGLPVVLGLFCAIPLLVHWADQSTPEL